ncbi:hypothetical protein ACMXYN_15035 [Neptuniibacter sp. PT8_73]|uniref:hypothetical protein n=1 Tax=Neptuniibacter sp. PT8_73 TaxID=3398206 RepID=UPI0039F548B7
MIATLRAQLPTNLSKLKKELRNDKLYKDLDDRLVSGIATLHSTREQFRITIYEIHEEKHWNKVSDTFNQFCKVYIPFLNRSTVFRELNTARFEKANSLKFGTVSESSLRSIKFKTCSDKELRWIWKNATKKKKKPTADDIKQSFQELQKRRETQKLLEDKSALKKVIKKAEGNDLAELLHLAIDALANK